MCTWAASAVRQRGRSLAESPQTAIAGRTYDDAGMRDRLRLALALVLTALGLDVLHREDWRVAVDFHHQRLQHAVRLDIERLGRL